MLGIALSSLESFYFIVACFATFFFILKLILASSVGLDDVETPDSEPVSDSAFNFLSLQTILAFLMGFGWIGLGCLHEGHASSLKAFMVAGGVGLVLMILAALLMMGVQKLNRTPTLDPHKAIGQVGEAYTRIPAKGSGSIRVEMGGKLEIWKAVSQADEDIQAFEKVKIIDEKEGLLFVVKLEQTV